MTTTLAPPALDLAKLAAAVNAARTPTVPADPPVETGPERQPRLAERVTVSEAMRHFNTGGDVLVCEHGDRKTVTVGPNTTIHNRQTTTWQDMVRQVAEWRNRYPKQRYYIVTGQRGADEWVLWGRKRFYANSKPIKLMGGTQGQCTAAMRLREKEMGWELRIRGRGDGWEDQPAWTPPTFESPDVIAAPAQLTTTIQEVVEQHLPGTSREDLRAKLVKDLAEQLLGMPVHEIEVIGARIPVDTVEFGNAVVEVDANGDAVCFHTTSGGYPTWDDR